MFALLDEEDGPKPVAATKAPAAKTAPAAKKPAKLPEKHAVPGRGVSAGRGIARTPRAPREFEGEVVGSEGRPRQSGRNDRRDKPRNNDARRNDRQDRSGRGREGLHRGGAGKGGWGKPGEEASLVPEFTAEGEQEEIVPDEPDNEVTLEDYEKAKAERKTALMASLKQKNKGGASKTVDESAFTGMKLTSKDDGVDVLSSFELEGSETIKGKRVRTKNGVQKTILDTGFKTTPSAPADDRGGRGGRGRGDRDSGHGVSRGRGFRDGGRGVVRGARPGNARGSGFSAKIDDDSAFPTLGRN